MLRCYLHDGSSALRFKLFGALAGADVGELEQCWRTTLSTIGGRAFVVDVTGMTSVDDAGRALLEIWSESGAEFVAKSPESHWLNEPIFGHAFVISTSEHAAPRNGLPFWLMGPALVIVLILLLPSTVWASDRSAGIPVSADMSAPPDRHSGAPALLSAVLSSYSPLAR